MIKMAAALRPSVKFAKYLPGILQCTSPAQLTCRAASTSGGKLNNPTVVVSDDGSTIVCWHPEPKFPYQCSKPLPRNPVEMEQAESVLKVQHTEMYDARHRPDGPTDLELEKIFFTTKHEWLPRPRKIYDSVPPRPDRDTI